MMLAPEPHDARESIDLGGTIRQCRPEETLKRIRPLFSQLGITRIANVTGLDDIGIPVSVAIRPLSRSLSVSQGKGLTQALADVSAVMESIEHYHAEYPPLPEFSGSYDELKEHYDLIDPKSLPPGSFPDGFELHSVVTPWLKGTNLLNNEPVYVPFYFCNLDTSITLKERLAVACTSNALASGNTVAEATLHAIYEAIERDATATPERGNEIDIGTIDGPASGLIERFRKAGGRVHVWEQPSEIGVPVYRCLVSAEGTLRGLVPFGGFGAHLSRQIALCRALTEAAQSRLTIISGSRDDRYPSDYARFRSAAGTGLSLPDSDLKPLQDCPTIEIESHLDANLLQLLEILRKRGHEEVVAVNMSKPSIGVPVVSIVIPGLKHIPDH